MDNALRQLLDSLDSIFERHEEVGDSDVRDQLAAAIRGGFVAPEPDFRLPPKFGTFSRGADKQVRTALQSFLSHPEVAEASRSLQTPEARLAAFQNIGVRSAKGTTYDEYFGHLSAEDITKAAARSVKDGLSLNLAVLKKTRRKPVEGDIFVMLPPDRLYLYGRVISTTADVAFSIPFNLLYVYRIRSKDKTPGPSLDPRELLIPPFVTNSQPWSRGYFETVEHRQLTAADRLAQHCFMNSYGRCFDEHGNELPGPVEPVGGHGVTTLWGIDQDVCKALGIPLAPNTSTRSE